MKLELKHLAPYLSYGISIEVNFQKQKYITDSWGLKCQRDYLISEYERGVKKGLTLNQVKPILRPLSDLTKEIEVNGEKIIPIRVFEKEEDFESNLQTLKLINNNNLDKFPYKWYVKLLEWHFDTDNLIGKKLAIDINTL